MVIVLIEILYCPFTVVYGYSYQVPRRKNFTILTNSTTILLRYLVIKNRIKRLQLPLYKFNLLKYYSGLMVIVKSCKDYK